MVLLDVVALEVLFACLVELEEVVEVEFDELAVLFDWVVFVEFNDVLFEEPVELDEVEFVEFVAFNDVKLLVMGPLVSPSLKSTGSLKPEVADEVIPLEGVIVAGFAVFNDVALFVFGGVVSPSLKSFGSLN